MNAHDLNTQLLDAVELCGSPRTSLRRRWSRQPRPRRHTGMAKATAYLASQRDRQRSARPGQRMRSTNSGSPRDMAEGLKMSALEAVRGNRTVVSAVQTLAGLYKEEAAFGRTGPQDVERPPSPSRRRASTDDRRRVPDPVRRQQPQPMKPWQGGPATRP